MKVLGWIMLVVGALATNYFGGGLPIAIAFMMIGWTIIIVEKISNK